MNIQQKILAFYGTFELECVLAGFVGGVTLGMIGLCLIFG